MSEQVSAAERASKASSAEQANEWAVGANERTDKRVAQYFNLGFWLIWTIAPLQKISGVKAQVFFQRVRQMQILRRLFSLWLEANDNNSPLSHATLQRCCALASGSVKTLVCTFHLSRPYFARTFPTSFWCLRRNRPSSTSCSEWHWPGHRAFEPRN